MNKSYGWKRKYKLRLFKYREIAEHEYLSYPLPEPELSEFIGFVKKKVSMGFKKRSANILLI